MESCTCIGLIFFALWMPSVSFAAQVLWPSCKWREVGAVGTWHQPIILLLLHLQTTCLTAGGLTIRPCFTFCLCVQACHQLLLHYLNDLFFRGLTYKDFTSNFFFFLDGEINWWHFTVRACATRTGCHEGSLMQLTLYPPCLKILQGHQRCKWVCRMHGSGSVTD